MNAYSHNNTAHNSNKLSDLPLSTYEQKELKVLLSKLSPDFVDQFYDCVDDEFDRVSSLSQANSRAIKLTICGAARALAAIKNSTSSKQNKRRIRSLLLKTIKPIDPRASNVIARIKLTSIIIEQILAMKECFLLANGREAHLLTFSCESWFSSDIDPVMDIQKARSVVMALLRRYADCDSVGVFEVQPLSKKNDLSKKKVLMLHCHVVIWREKWSWREIESFREKCEVRMSNSLLRSPFHRRQIKDANEDVLRIGSYLSKIPTHYKRYDEDSSRVISGKSMSQALLLRHFEILSYLPLKSLIFATGDQGRALKTGIWDEFMVWRGQQNKGKTFPVVSDKAQQRAWKEFWAAKNSNYCKPPTVRFRREVSK